MNDENTTGSTKEMDEEQLDETKDEGRSDETDEEQPDETNEGRSDERKDGRSDKATAGPEGIDVPVSPPDPETDDHVLPLDDLRYPDLTFDDEGLDPRCGFSLFRTLDREGIEEWLDDLSGALRSHDLGITATDGHVVFGIAPEGVELTYEPEDEGERTGELELSVRMRAKVMVCSDDPEEKTGARTGSGFIPLGMVTDPDSKYRCYNWIDNPFDSSDRNIFEG